MNVFEKHLILHDEVKRVVGLIGDYIVCGGSSSDDYARALYDEAQGYRSKLNELCELPDAEG